MRNRLNLATWILACVVLLTTCPVQRVVHAQAAQTDTLRLADVRSLAAMQDPVAAQSALAHAASILREKNLGASRLPQLSLTGQATWQNEVPEIGFGNVSIDGPPLEQYRAQVEMQWSLYDGGRSSLQQDAERVRREEQQAGIAFRLHRLMDGASETFYAALFQDAQIRVLNASARALSDRLAFMQVRVRDGAATAADAAALEAEWLRLIQDLEQARALHRAALEVLGAFLGRDIPSNTELIPPDFSDHLTTLRTLETFSAPEVEELEMREERLRAEAAATSSVRRPQVSLFGQAGIGRPSPFNFLDSEVGPFALAGVRMQWSLMDWGLARRNREVMEVQAELTGTARASTERRIQRDLTDDIALEAHLAARAESDARIVALRQTVVDATQEQLEAGAQLPAVFAERYAELTAAKVAMERNRIERSRAQYRILSALGRLPAPGHSTESTRTGNQP